MDRMFIIAPTYNIAKHYASKIGVNSNLMTICVDRLDINNLRGLRNIKVTVLNRYECCEQLLDFALILSTKTTIKLEFENV